MPSWTEFRIAGRGVLLLARFDADFLRHFDRTAAGALRSFWLLLFLLPVAVLPDYLLIRPLPSPGLFLAADVVGYTLSCILFPMVLLIVERIIERQREVPGCIAVLNWYALLDLALQLPGVVLKIIDPASGVAHGLLLIAFLFGIAVRVFLLLHCLRVVLWQAIALAVISAALDIAVAHLTLALGQVPLAAVS